MGRLAAGGPVGFTGRPGEPDRSGWSRSCCWRWSRCATTSARSAWACDCSFTRCAALWFAVARRMAARVGGMSWSGGPLGVVAAGAIVAWSLNLYNFMDGNDGLAAGMAILGFSAYGVGAVIADVSAIAFFALAAATLPFLAVNFPPSRMIMGDVGAVPMGFLAAAFGVARWWPAALAGVVSGARVPALRRGRDDHARAPRVASRADLGGASQSLLPASAPAGRRTSRNARDLCVLDGGLRHHGARLPALG